MLSGSCYLSFGRIEVFVRKEKNNYRVITLLVIDPGAVLVSKTIVQCNIIAL